MRELSAAGESSVARDVFTAFLALVDHYLAPLISVCRITVANIRRLPHFSHDTSPGRTMAATVLGAESCIGKQVGVLVPEGGVKLNFIVKDDQAQVDCPSVVVSSSRRRAIAPPHDVWRIWEGVVAQEFS